jgi:hypothetical protein
VGVEGDPVDDGGDEAGSGKTVPHSLNGRFVPIAVEARSSRSVMTWNSSSAPRRSQQLAGAPEARPDQGTGHGPAAHVGIVAGSA